jgi:lipopolysaccharide transport system ATP-binding protein
MSDTVIQVDNISKYYRLGVIGTGTLTQDLSRWWAMLRGRPDPTLRVDQVHTARGKSNDDYIWALKDISFEVKKGETLGVIGGNGAGKSTLLKILSRVTAPTTGECRIKGRIASLLEVGTGFHPELTGRENIFLNGTILGMTREEIRRKFNEIVAFSEVEKYIDTPVKRYSSGMYVRLAFAVAAYLDPEILIIDEVLAVGDSAFQKKCLGKMGDVAKEGRTVLFVSHNMAAIQSLCSKTILINSGKVISEGKTEMIISDYMQSSQIELYSDLKSRKDRIGTSTIIFTNIEFLDNYNNRIGIILSGQHLRIGLDFHVNLDIAKDQRVVISIGINNALGENLLLFSNNLTGDHIFINSSNGRIICDIPTLPILGGSYSVNLYAELNGVIADWVINASRLQVESGDFFGTGNLPPSTHTKFLVKHKWFVE